MRSKKTLAKRAGGWTFAVERQSEFPQRFPQAGKRRDGPLGIPPSQPKSRTNGIRPVYYAVSRSQTGEASDGAWAAKQSHRQQQERAQKAQHSGNRDAENAERQGHKPHEGVNHESQQRNGPAQNEQNAPQEESSHGYLAPELLSVTAHTCAKFPPFTNDYDGEG